MGLTLKLLGQFELHDSSGGKLELPTRKIRALISYLAVNADRPQPRERLMELLWGDRGDKQARQSLNHALREIRKLAEDEGLTILDTDGEFVALRGDAFECDAARFQAVLDTDPPRAAALYTGPFLDGFSLSEPAFDEWLSATRAEFLRCACDALEAAAKSAATPAAIDHTRRLLALDPLREDAHRRLMQLLQQSGDRAGALRQYQACAEILKRELQLDPEAATRTLFENIREDIDTAAPEEPSASGTASTQADDPGDVRDLSPIPLPVGFRDSQKTKSQKASFAKILQLMRRPHAAGAVVIAALTIGGLISVWLLSGSGPVRTEQKHNADTLRHDKPSIAILPFANMSDDKEQEYFSDGLAEDLLTDLSKITALRVISQSTMFAYKGKSRNIRAMAKELGITHVVEGSVRKAGERVRITAQLINANSGTAVWAERYDRNLKDIFDLQDDVRKKIISALSLKLAPEETARIAKKGTQNVEAYDFYLRGRHQEGSFTRNGVLGAIKSYEKAITLDPGYANSYARLANMFDFKVRLGWSGDAERDRQKALEFASKSVELDRNNPFSHWTYGRIISRLGSGSINDQWQAIRSMQRAIELDVNYADAYAFISLLYIGIGNSDKASKTIEMAFKLNAQPPFWYIQNRAIISYMLGDYRAAINDLNEAEKRNPTAVFVHWWLAAAYAQAGESDDAAWAVEEMKTLGYEPTIGKLVESAALLHFAPYKERFAAGLRKAGIPE